MNAADARVEAHKIIDRAESVNKKIGVFTRAGRLSAVRTDATSFADKMASETHKLIGVYNGKCLVEWLESDLIEYA